MTDRAPAEPFAFERPRIVLTGSGRMSEDHAALYLGVSTRTLRRWRQHDEGPNYDRIAGRVWYAIGSLDAYLDSCRHETTR